MSTYGYVRVSTREQNESRPTEKPPNFDDVCAKWRTGKLSARGAAKQLGITHRTFIKWAEKSAVC